MECMRCPEPDRPEPKVTNHVMNTHDVNGMSMSTIYTTSSSVVVAGETELQVQIVMMTIDDLDRKDRRRRRRHSTRSEDSADAALNQGGNVQSTYIPRNITFLRGVPRVICRQFMTCDFCLVFCFGSLDYKTHCFNM